MTDAIAPAPLPASAPLPIAGFVLAGGQSSRMGRDKASVPLGGRPMVDIAAEKLRGFCASVSIAGNRDDLASIAPVVREARLLTGPIAGIEAGLHAASAPWSLFVPVDAPLVPAALLRHWASAVLAAERRGVRLSFVSAGGVRQPTFCLLHGSCAGPVTAAAERGERKLGAVFAQVAAQLGPNALWIADAALFAPPGTADVLACFANINTPEDLRAAEGAVLAGRGAVGY